MKRKTAILFVGAFALSAVLSGCGGNKEATEAANESVESEDPEGKAKNCDDAEEEEKKEEEETADADKKVGIFLPSASDDPRWSSDVETLQHTLEDEGYDAEVFFSDESGENQASQISEILDDENTSALIIAPADAYGLNDVLEQAYEKSIPVISYDEQIMDTDKVNYFVTFDTRKAGKMVGDSIIKKMDLEKASEEKRTLSIELLMGSPDDRAALFFYNGVMEKLPPLLRGLCAIAPVYYVTGNHEWRVPGLRGILAQMRACGVTVLQDDWRVLRRGEDALVLAGTDDPCGPAERKTPAELIAEIRAEAGEAAFLLLLTHRNDQLPQWSALGVQAVLAGHCHGGVVRLPFVGGLFGTDRRLCPAWDAGLYRQGETALYVSRGLGYTNVHFRLFNRPEVAVIVLRRGDPAINS